ncbi:MULTISPECIES: hypothetical protein [unclassified Thermoactinomyces]|uniref:hypothetical protein n=1 Tax=unclassified Thermoactinomyces TaxID=2634588 RepID=UPI0018DC0502|nr:MULTISPECIES: hypothetical protein [unclassified Thermoactinomyces]MBH8599087.1 hypothetical protein [Thermoactinomyces sp. CICC 10523]MBH8607982.1 hypothetical protein [Thermoactinomyces sp. CICC 10521]
MRKKTELAKEAYRSGNVKKALWIAKSFRIGLSKDDRDKIVRAYECLVHPDFYLMLGKSPEEEIEKGKRVFEEKIL